MVQSFIKNEFKRTFFRWQLGVCFLAFLFLYHHIMQQDYPVRPNQSYAEVISLSNPFSAFLQAMGGPMHGYFVLVFPLLIAVLCTDHLYLDYKSGFFQFAMQRIEAKRYYRYKAIAVSVVTFSVAIVFQLSGFLLSIFTRPFVLPKPGLNEGLENLGLSSPLFFTHHPFLYVLIIMGLTALSSIAYALFGMLLANVSKSIFVISGVPFLFHLIVGQLFYILGAELWAPLNYLSPMNMVGIFIFNASYSFFMVTIYWLLLSVAFYLLGFYFYQRQFGQDATVASKLSQVG